MAQSRREQLQAYRFMQRRVRTALLDSDPDTNDAPLSRMGAATYAGVMVAILVLAGVGIYGALVPGGSSAWKKAGTLIVEKDTTTRYVYLHKVLYQVSNYASAKLLLGPRLTTASVSNRSLAGAQHGGNIGIQGAPDYVPDADHVVGPTWSMCVDGDLTAATEHQPYFDAGQRAAGNVVTKAVLLTASGTDYLWWNGKVYPIPKTSETELGYSGAAPVSVSPHFIEALPHGETIAPIALSDAGRPGLAIGGRPFPVGDVVYKIFSGNVRTYYLVRATSVQLLTPVQALLQLGSTQTPNHVAGATSIPFGVLLKPVPPARVTPIAYRQPSVLPSLQDPTGRLMQLCAVYPLDQAPYAVFGAKSPVPAGDAVGGSVRMNNRDGALVEVAPSAKNPITTTYFVSDTSMKFPITPAGLTALELPTTKIAHLLPTVLDLIPTGLQLDPAAARTVIGAGGAGPPATGS